MKDDGTLDKIGSIIFLNPLKDIDIDMYKKVLQVFITCGDQGT